MKNLGQVHNETVAFIKKLTASSRFVEPVEDVSLHEAVLAMLNGDSNLYRIFQELVDYLSTIEEVNAADAAAFRLATCIIATTIYCRATPLE